VGSVATTGTGAASSTAPSALGAGTVLIDGTGTLSLAAPTAAGAGTVATGGVTGTGAGLLTGPTAAGVGTVAITGTGALSLGAATVAGIESSSPWDEPLSGHTIPGSFGEAMQEIRLAVHAIGSQRFKQT